MAQNRDTRAPGSARPILALGASIGLGLAVASLLSTPSNEGELPSGSVARVDGVAIRSESYARLVAALAADRRTPLADEDRRRVLERLIDEELLVQYAVDLGLVQTDRRVRADLVTAVLAALNAATDTYEPDEAAIAEFYTDNRAYFALPARVHAQRVFVARGEDADAARGRAGEASRRLHNGESVEAVRTVLGDEVIAPVPDGPLPPAKLREYLGPSALRAALALMPGEASDPVETPQGFHVVVLIDRTDARELPLDDVQPQVVAEMKRREGDRRLRQKLEDLRQEADILTIAPLPAPP